MRSRLVGWTFDVLAWLVGHTNGHGWQRWCTSAWRVAAILSRGTLVETHIHGRRVRVPAGYPYPLWSRQWPNYNAPLLEAAHEATLLRDGPIRVVDVGAAVGDTALMLLANLPIGTIEDLLCVEPDNQFAGLARANLRGEPAVRIRQALLARSETNVRDLVRTHPGTASAQGRERRPAVPLDHLCPERVDVLKIDVDGMDGQVLAGARRHLAVDHPVVIFEWHPVLYERTGNDWREPFEVLHDAGYRQAVWFDKFGSCAGIADVGDADLLEHRARTCLVDRSTEDWHYDVIAVPPGPGSRAGAARLATLFHARSRLSRC
ncbi:MAG: FkbM family methyltransferase [Actinomycetota bacterium]|nr:FkbM family methyltransferase [Actinomycetota bacterium]